MMFKLPIDKKNFLLIVGVLMVVFIVGFYLPNRQYQARQKDVPPELVDNPDAVVVIYTDNGFERGEVKINRGKTVVWVNHSKKPMWVASDPHPSHINLGGFDQKGSTSPNPDSQSLIPAAEAHNQGYQYTFNKAGVFKYHNHIVPGDRGIVEVVE